MNPKFGPPVAGSTHLNSKKSIIVLAKGLPSFPKRPALNIKLTPEKIPDSRTRPLPGSGACTGPVTVRAYGTPRCHSATHQTSSALTNRGYRDLPNCIYYSKEYKQIMKEKGQERGHVVNPNFVEYLMGFPKDWTRFNNRSDPPIYDRKPAGQQIEINYSL